MFKDIFIAKGERMTDKDGNTICFAARDIMWIDDDFGVDAFDRWAIEPTEDAPFVYDTGLGAPAFWVDGVSRFFDRSIAEDNEARRKLGKPQLATYTPSFGICIDRADRF